MAKQSSTYNPAIHHRRSIRLKGYDYSQAGLYFITICAQDRQCLFGQIQNNEMHLSQYGCIAHQQWSTLCERFPHIELYEFQIMPNHMHGIIHVGATLAVAHDDNTVAHDNGAGASPAPTGTKTIGDIVGAYKSLVTNECLKIHKTNHPNIHMGKIWQRNYYEHIIRNEISLQRIRLYIINNPAKWQSDKFNSHHPTNS